MIYFIYKQNTQTLRTYQLCWILHPILGVLKGSRNGLYIQLKWIENLWDEFIQQDDLYSLCHEFCSKNKWVEYRFISIDEINRIEKSA